MMTPEQIVELEALAEKATPGPWGVYAQTIAASTPERRAANAKAEMSLQVELTTEMVEHIYLLAAGDKCPAITGCGPTSAANADLIVTLVNNLPAILTALKAQQPDEAPEKHAGAMANDLGLLAEIHADQLEDFPEALQHAQQTLANWTAYLLGGR